MNLPKGLPLGFEEICVDFWDFERGAGAILPGGGARLKQQMYLYLPDPDQEIRRSKHRRLATRQEVLLWKSCSARPVFLRKLT